MVQRVLLPPHSFQSFSLQSLIELTNEESHHLIHVLRMKKGDDLLGFDGRGASCKGALEILNQKYFFKPTSQPIYFEKSKNVLPLTLAIGILKGQAMESVVEKCVELGVERLQPLITEHSVVQIHKKGPLFFQERWQKIADQSLKQCGRVFRMEVDLPLSLNSINFTKQNLWIYCDETQASNDLNQSNFIGTSLNHISFSKQNYYSILIGPEGGWSEKERDLMNQNHMMQVHLGPLILRAETAAIYSVSVLSFLIRNT